MPNVQLLDIVKRHKTYEGIRSVAVPTPDGGEEIYFQPDIYDGTTTVTPGADPVTLATAETYLERDVVIGAIPYAEVTNQAGGKTVTIG